jgi:hypothetical protein
MSQDRPAWSDPTDPSKALATVDFVSGGGGGGLSYIYSNKSDYGVFQESSSINAATDTGCDHEHQERGVVMGFSLGYAQRVNSQSNNHPIGGSYLPNDQRRHCSLR